MSGAWQNYPQEWGAQAQAVWQAGETHEQPLLDLVPNGQLWRVSIAGDVLVTLTWGTSSARQVVVDAPLCADLPGNVSAKASPRTADGAVAKVTVANVSGVGPCLLRRLLSTLVALALPDDAARFVALAASVVNVRGTAVNLNAGESVPLVSGSSLTSGTGFVEFEP